MSEDDEVGVWPDDETLMRRIFELVRAQPVRVFTGSIVTGSIDYDTWLLERMWRLE